MRGQRFTEKAIKVVMLAQEEARRLGHNFVGTEQVRTWILLTRVFTRASVNAGASASGGANAGRGPARF